MVLFLVVKRQQWKKCPSILTNKHIKTIRIPGGECNYHLNEVDKNAHPWKSHVSSHHPGFVTVTCHVNHHMFNGIQIPTTQRIRQIFDARIVSHPILLKILSSSNWVKVLEALYQTNNGPVIGSFSGHKGSVWSLGQQRIDQRWVKKCFRDDVWVRTQKSVGKAYRKSSLVFFFGGVLPVPDNAFNRITPSSGIWTGMSNPYPCFESPFIKNFTLWYFKPTMAQIYLRSVEPWLVFF